MALKSHQSIHAEHLLSMNPPRPDTEEAGDEIDGDDRLVDPNVTDGDGKNALRIAIGNGSPIDLINKLLDRLVSVL